ncbi:MAG: PPE domain-containing protein, partial [Geodermatophilaceae bacterium]
MSSDTTSGPDEDFGGPTPGGEYDVTTPEQDRQAEVDAILDSLPLFGGSGGGAPDFRALKIGDHAGMLVMMDPAAARAAAQAWGKVATQYESTEQTLRGYGETLKDGWRSEASKPFMGYVGGSLSSLQEWAAEARTNQTRLDRLGDAIETAKIEMEALYQSYKSEVAEIDKDTFGPTLFGIDKDADDMQEMVDEKTAQSLIIMERLAGVLTGTVIQDGPKWAGPKGFAPPKLSGAAPGAPGGGAPQAPGGGGGAAPAAPAAPSGARPQAPSGPRPQAPRPPA